MADWGGGMYASCTPGPIIEIIITIIDVLAIDDP